MRHGLLVMISDRSLIMSKISIGSDQYAKYSVPTGRHFRANFRYRCVSKITHSTNDNEARYRDLSHPALRVPGSNSSSARESSTRRRTLGFIGAVCRSATLLPGLPLIDEKNRGNPFRGPGGGVSVAKSEVHRGKKEREEPVPRKIGDWGGRGVPPRARQATPAGNSRRHGNTPEASPCASHPRTPQTLPRLSSFSSVCSLTHTLPPFSSHPSHRFFHPVSPCRSPPARESTRNPYRSADEFEVLRILRGVLLTTRSSAITLSFSLALPPRLSLSLPSFFAQLVPTCLSPRFLRNPSAPATCSPHTARVYPIRFQESRVIGSRFVFVVLHRLHET